MYFIAIISIIILQFLAKTLLQKFEIKNIFVGLTEKLLKIFVIILNAKICENTFNTLGNYF